MTGPAQGDDFEVTVFLLVLSRRAVSIGRNMPAPEAEQVPARDHRSPVIYRRPLTFQRLEAPYPGQP